MHTYSRTKSRESADTKSGNTFISCSLIGQSRNSPGSSRSLTSHLLFLPLLPPLLLCDEYFSFPSSPSSSLLSSSSSSVVCLLLIHFLPSSALLSPLFFLCVTFTSPFFSCSLYLLFRLLFSSLLLEMISSCLFFFIPHCPYCVSFLCFCVIFSAFTVLLSPPVVLLCPCRPLSA